MSSSTPEKKLLHAAYRNDINEVRRLLLDKRIDINWINKVSTGVDNNCSNKPILAFARRITYTCNSIYLYNIYVNVSNPRLSVPEGMYLLSLSHDL